MGRKPGVYTISRDGSLIFIMLRITNIGGAPQTFYAAYQKAADTSWRCRTCDSVVYGPPLNTHCTRLDGPAVVRISNAT